MDNYRKFLTRPAVIDWLQWGEFPECDKLGTVDYPRVTLELISEYKSAIEAEKARSAKLLAALKTRIEFQHECAKLNCKECHDNGLAMLNLIEVYYAETNSQPEAGE